MKTIIAHILLLSFVLQLGKSAAIDHLAQRFYQVISSSSDSRDVGGFFDDIFNDALCENQEKNEEQLQKNFSNDLICAQEKIHTAFVRFAVIQKLYLLYSSHLDSGFYFSLIQPPD